VKRLIVTVMLAMMLVFVATVPASAATHHTKLWHLEHPGGPASGTKWIPLAKYAGWTHNHRTLRHLACLMMNEDTARPWAISPTDDWGLTQLNRLSWCAAFRRVTGHPFVRGALNPLLNLRMAWHIYHVVQHNSWLPAWRGDPAATY